MRCVRWGPKRQYHGQIALKCSIRRASVAAFQREIRTGALIIAAILIACFAAPAVSAQQLKLTPYNLSGVYDIGQKAGWAASAIEAMNGSRRLGGSGNTIDRQSPPTANCNFSQEICSDSRIRPTLDTFLLGR